MPNPSPSSALPCTSLLVIDLPNDGSLLRRLGHLPSIVILLLQRRRRRLHSPTKRNGRRRRKHGQIRTAHNRRSRRIRRQPLQRRLRLAQGRCRWPFWLVGNKHIRRGESCFARWTAVGIARRARGAAERTCGHRRAGRRQHHRPSVGGCRGHWELGGRTLGEIVLARRVEVGALIRKTQGWCLDGCRC